MDRRRICEAVGRALERLTAHARERPVASRALFDMNPKDILVVGVKGTLTAFEKTTGQRLWSTRLKSSMSSDFVSVLADNSHVYAHTGGEIFCVNLLTGDGVWSDKLAGMGYGIASLAVPGFGASAIPLPAEKMRQAAASDTATHASG